MTKKQLLQLVQHGFKKQVLEDEIALEMHGTHTHCLTKDFPSINLQIGVYPQHNEYQLSHLDNGAIIRSFPKAKLYELLHYLDDLERVAEEFKNVEHLLAPLFRKWEWPKQVPNN